MTEGHRDQAELQELRVHQATEDPVARLEIMVQMDLGERKDALDRRAHLVGLLILAITVDPESGYDRRRRDQRT